MSSPDSRQKQNIVLELQNVHASYGLGEVLRGLSLSVKKGEVVALIGANGAGKTTTLRAICGALRVSGGNIIFDGRSMVGVPMHRAVSLGIAYVAERRLLFKSLDVMDNLVLGAFYRRSTGQAELQKDLDEVLDLFPILKKRAKQLSTTLSGGEQQMLAIGRGLMAKPKLLMLDEPSLGLGPLVIREVMKTVARLRDLGISVLLVEQNARAALGVADRAFVIENGQIALEGSAAELSCDDRVCTAYLGGRRA